MSVTLAMKAGGMQSSATARAIKLPRTSGASGVSKLSSLNSSRSRLNPAVRGREIQVTLTKIKRSGLWYYLPSKSNSFLNSRKYHVL